MYEIYNKYLFLNDINFVLTSIIFMMFIFLYYLNRNLSYIPFIVLFFVEGIALAHLKFVPINTYFVLIMCTILLLKIMSILINKEIVESVNKRFLTLYDAVTIAIYVVAGVCINENIVIYGFLNFIGNAIFFYIRIYKYLSKIKKDSEALSVSIDKGENFLKDINREISIQYDDEKALAKKQNEFENLYNMLVSNVEKSIFVVYENSNKIHRNKNFDIMFKDEDFKTDDVDEFFINYFVEGEDILKYVKSKPKNLLLEKRTITSFNDNKYELYVCDINLKNEKFKLFIFDNVTNMHKMRDEVKLNSKSYKKLIEVMEDGVIITNKDYVYYMNNSVKQILNIVDKYHKIISVEELAEYIDIEYRDKFVKNIHKGDFKKEAKIWNVRTTKNKVLKICGIPVNIDNKDLSLIIITDVTEGKNIIDYIDEREKIYRLLLETLPEGIAVIDRNNREKIYNNKYILDILNFITVEKFNEIIDSFIESNEFDTQKILELDDNKMKLSVAMTDIKEQNVYIVVFKIFENKKELDDIKEDIEKLQKKDAFKQQFCIDVVDKIEAPVNDLLYINKVMKQNNQENNDSLIDSHINIAKQGTYRLKKILGNMHDIINIENNKCNLDFKLFDIVRLVKDIVHLSKYYVNKKGLKIELECEEPEILVYLDLNKMQSIILNILSNAIKFTQPGGEIKVLIEKKIDFIVISVKDSGLGIPKEKLDFIFENFEQVDKSLSRVAEGMGIGLYLAKKLAVMQDVHLKVYSEVDKGSVFKILIKNELKSKTKNKKKYNFTVDEEAVHVQYSDIYLL